MHERMLPLLSAGAIAAAFLGTARGDDKIEPIPGRVESLKDFRTAAKALFKAADSDNDGKISKEEAVDAANLIVGGYFFRADADGDGKVTEQEAIQAREKVFDRRPILRHIYDRTKKETAEQGTREQLLQLGRDVQKTVDADKDGAIDAKELRRAVATGVDTLFLTADRDGDGRLSPGEVNFAVVEIGRAAFQASFDNADLDKNGTINREEFSKAVVNPALVFFRVADQNEDGELSTEELRKGLKALLGEFRRLKPTPAADSLPNQAIDAINKPK